MATTRPNIRDVVPPAAEIDPREEALSPASILRAQAETWTERTNGEIVAEVEPARASADRLAYWFSFVVPALDKYRYRLFRVEHGIELYPLRLADGRGAGDVVEVRDEDAFYEVLRRTFAEPRTLALVRRLRSMIAERDTTLDAPPEPLAALTRAADAWSTHAGRGWARVGGYLVPAGVTGSVPGAVMRAAVARNLALLVDVVRRWDEQIPGVDAGHVSVVRQLLAICFRQDPEADEEKIERPAAEVPEGPRP